MRRPVTPTQGRKGAKVPSRPKVYPVAYVPPSSLKGADYNPRNMELPELHRLAQNIAEFGFLDAVSACKEDNELLGGHQRVRAALMLLSGEYAPLNPDGTAMLGWERPEKIPAIFVEGLSDRQRKTVNLSLNRISGNWDYDKVVSVVKDLHAQAMADVDEAMKDVDRQLKAIDALAATGFSAAEITDYLDMSTDTERGRGPLPAKGVPKLTLEFTSKETRDAFKSFLSAVVAEDEPSGDSLAKRLGIVVKRKGN